MIYLTSENMFNLQDAELKRVALIRPDIKIAYCKVCFEDFPLADHVVNDWGFLDAPSYLKERYKEGKLKDETYAEWYRNYLRKIWFSYSNCIYKALADKVEVILVYPSLPEYKITAKVLISFLTEYVEQVKLFTTVNDLLKGVQ